MVGKKLVALGIVAMALAAAGCQDKKELTQIGINQYVVHEALDASRQGFLDVLKENGYVEGENIEVDYKNAQGEQPTALSIAQDFAAKKKDLIFAIATSSAQASYNATKDIPILITAVTDPVDAGIADSFENPGKNVTGTSDGVPIGPQLEILKKVLPDAKTIGVIYNTSEPNSTYQVNELKKEAAKMGFTVKEAGITALSDVNAVLPSVLKDVDVLYTPTDNMVASAYALIVKLANDEKVPVFCAEDAGVAVGGLISAGLDYYELGRETGLMAIEVLKGKAPKDLPISTMKNPVIVVNKKAAADLGITIPEEILSVAKVAGEK